MKKMIKIAFVAAFAAIAGYGVYANQKSEVLSDLTLANVEALAGSGETTIECCLALWGTCKGDIKAPYVCVVLLIFVVVIYDILEYRLDILMR